MAPNADIAEKDHLWMGTRLNWFTAFFKGVAAIYRHKKYPWVCGVEMQI